MSRMGAKEKEKKEEKRSEKETKKVRADEKEVDRIVAQRTKSLRRAVKVQNTGTGAGARAVSKAIASGQADLVKAKKDMVNVGPSRKAVKEHLAKSGYSDEVPNFKDWALCTSNPRASPAVRCPIQINPVPTLRTTVATTVYKKSFAMAGTRQMNIIFWPGHGEMPDDVVIPSGGGTFPYNLDDVSFHAGCVRIGTSGDTTFSVGPVDWESESASYSRKNTIGASWESSVDAPLRSTLVDSACSAISTVTPLPYKGSDFQGFHTRWRMTGMSVKLICKDYTEALEVSSVMPYTRNPPPSGTDTFNSFYANDPSYKTVNIAPVAGRAEYELIVPYQMSQLGFWHTASDDNGPAFATPYTSPCLALCIKTAITAGNFDVQTTCHWELGGKSLNSVSVPTFQSTTNNAIVERAAQTVRSSQGAKGSPSIMSHIASAVEAIAHEGLDVAASFGIRALKAGAAMAMAI